jgi:hypothetical protein
VRDHRCRPATDPARADRLGNPSAAEQGDEADEAFGGMVASMDMPPHARADSFGCGHRFAAYPRCYADMTSRRAVSRISNMTLCVLLAGTAIGAAMAGEPSPIADCWSEIPADARSGLHIVPLGPAPLDGTCRSHVSADFNGDSQADHAVLVGSANGEGDSSLLLFVKEDAWTLSIVRTWHRSHAPTTLRLMPPGRYMRSGGLLESLEGDEVPSLVSKHVGVVAGSWVYFWNARRWVSVRFAR